MSVSDVRIQGTLSGRWNGQGTEDDRRGRHVEPLPGNLWDFPDNTKKDFSLCFEKKVKLR